MSCVTIATHVHGECCVADHSPGDALPVLQESGQPLDRLRRDLHELGRCGRISTQCLVAYTAERMGEPVEEVEDAIIELLGDPGAGEVATDMRISEELLMGLHSCLLGNG